MFTALLVACLISAPTDCRTHEMLIQSTMPTAACIEAQARAATWLSEHPGMTQQSLTVRPGRSA